MKQMVEGITTELIDVPANARASMHFNCEFDSNEIYEEDAQSAKHDRQKISIHRWITIDRCDDGENENNSICFNPEFDSNEINESLCHDEQHDEPRIAIVRGILICDETAKFRISL
jgi:hypothetical protein